jgi:DNA-binding SARP family transcriptional activator
MRTSTTETPGNPFPKQHLRVYTFGRFQIEWFDPETGQITPFPPERLHGQNAGTALGLFKALLSCPDRFATRSWLNEQFWPTSRHRAAEERLNDVVSSLRTLLRPKGNTDMFVHFVYGTNGRGAGYRLDSYPHLRCDADAFEWYVKHALLLDQRGQDATACWEHAYTLAECGMYLPEQIEDDWSRARRDYLSGLVRDCVHRWTQLLQQMGYVDEAIMRLRSYWLEHPTDEDALRPLLEMLGECERFGEAEECYAKALAMLTEECQAPDGRTIDAIEAVRALKVQQKRSTTVTATMTRLPLSFSLQKNATLFPSSPMAMQDIIHSELLAQNYWLAIKQQQLVTMLSIWGEQVLLCDELQTWINQEMNIFDKILPASFSESEKKVSRRQALVALAALPLSLFVNDQLEPTKAHFTEAFLSRCAASIVACQHLMRGDGLAEVESLLPRYLPLLMTLALHPSQHQQAAAKLGVQANILQASIAMHRLQFERREYYCHQAVKCGTIADDAPLHAAALMYLGYTYSFCQPFRLEMAKGAFFEALRVLGQTDDLLQSDICVGLADVFAQDGDVKQAQMQLGRAQDCFPARPEDQSSFLYAGCDLSILYQWEGKMYLNLAQHHPDGVYAQKAWNAFLQGENVPSSFACSNNETLIYHADAARCLGDLDLYAQLLQDGAGLAIKLGSQKRYSEAFEVYHRTPEKWRDEPKIQDLGKNIFQHMPAQGEIHG